MKIGTTQLGQCVTCEDGCNALGPVSAGHSGRDATGADANALSRQCLSGANGCRALTAVCERCRGAHGTLGGECQVVDGHKALGAARDRCRNNIALRAVLTDAEAGSALGTFCDMHRCAQGSLGGA